MDSYRFKVERFRRARRDRNELFPLNLKLSPIYNTKSEVVVAKRFLKFYKLDIQACAKEAWKPVAVLGAIKNKIWKCIVRAGNRKNGSTG